MVFPFSSFSSNSYFLKSIDDIISPTLGSLVSLLLFIPYLAVAVRRLHDVNKSGWGYLIAFTVLGVIFLIVWWCGDSIKTNNKY